MASESIDIEVLIYKYLRGTLSREEQVRLDGWLQEERNRVIFERLCDKKRILEKMFRLDTYDEKQSLLKMEKRMRVTRYRVMRLWWMAVASLLLPLLVGTWLWTRERMDVSDKRVVPGTTCALLSLADGRVVRLHQDSTCVLQLMEGGVFKNEGGVLSYRADTTGKMNMEYNRVETPRGGEYRVALPDGTTVWLNAGSSLRFPGTFPGEERRVYASGELYFEVTRDRKHPFRVVVDEAYTVEVLGTEFNLRAYEGSPSATTLVKGSVAILENGITTRLSPGQQAVKSCTGGNVEVRNVEVASFVAWRQGYFLFENERLEDILEELARWYDVEVFFENQSSRDERFSVEIRRHENFREVLDLIEQTGSVQIRINGNSVFVK